MQYSISLWRGHLNRRGSSEARCVASGRWQGTRWQVQTKHVQLCRTRGLKRRSARYADQMVLWLPGPAALCHPVCHHPHLSSCLFLSLVVDCQANHTYSPRLPMPSSPAIV